MTHINQQGFTLIELVMVIIILGILSYGAVGLFATRDAFTPAIVKNQFISSARLAQQAALARQMNTPVRLVINQTASQVIFDVVQGTTILNSRAVDRDGSALNVATTPFVNTCGSYTTSFPVSISFNGNGDTGANWHACVAGQVSYNLCVAPTGYAHESTCL